VVYNNWLFVAFSPPEKFDAIKRPAWIVSRLLAVTYIKRGLNNNILLCNQEN